MEIWIYFLSVKEYRITRRIYINEETVCVVYQKIFIFTEENTFIGTDYVRTSSKYVKKQNKKK